MRSRFNTIFRAVLVIAIATMMTSCSFKTLYNQLDNMILYYVEGMVSLDSMLEQKVEQRTLLLIKWHRNTQLNQYADWLRELQGDINKQLTEEKIHKNIVRLDTFWKSIILKLDEEMALLLPSLNKEQAKELFENIKEKNDEFREEYIVLNDNERIEQYTESITDSYETWLGDLTDEQEIFVKQAAARVQSTAKYRLERRQLWQNSLKRILDTNESQSNKAEALRQFFTNYHNQGNVSMDRIMKENKAIFSWLTLKIVHSMSNDQKLHFTSTTNDYIRMFTELAQER